MRLKEELKGSMIYDKSLDRNIEVNDENIELLKSVNAPVFEEEKNDNYKPKPNKRNISDSDGEGNVNES